MQRRPLIAVGVLVAVVGAVLILVGIMRGADGVWGTSAGSSTQTAGSDGTGASEDGLRAPDGAETEDSAETPGPSPTAEPPVAATPPEASGFALRIPGIDLDADLHAEGLRDGRINPPAGTVMWFTGYDRVPPGEVGTSVIAGHVIAQGRPDAFSDLAAVNVGDSVEIVQDDGSTSDFRVVRAEVVDKDDLTHDQDVWGENSSVRRLVIVTCDDAYGFRDDGHRVANYVVVAEPA